MEAVIGVVGTLLGTILGWLLNSISQKGNLTFYFLKWSDAFKCNCFGDIVRCNNIEEAQYYTFELNFDLYNSSAEVKIMRDIKILFWGNGEQCIREYHPDDHRSQRVSAHRTIYDKVDVLNIPPKSVSNLIWSCGEWDQDGSIKEILQTTKICLQYRDEKNKLKQQIIKEEKYSDYFKNHPVED